MTKEQRRIACAEERGWTGIEYYKYHDACGFTGFHGPDCQPSEIPDPESSLNDCKPLIEIATQRRIRFELTWNEIGRWECTFGCITICSETTPEPAIVEAFLKWRGRL